MRTITSAELAFLKRVEALSSLDLTALGLSDKSQVEPMNDGGMGSLYFPAPNHPQSNRRFGKQIAEGTFNDIDGMPISFTINIDDEGLLYELDMWRVDSNPLQHLPAEQDEIRMIS